MFESGIRAGSEGEVKPKRFIQGTDEVLAGSIIILSSHSNRSVVFMSSCIIRHHIAVL